MEGGEKNNDKPLVRGITSSGFRISGQIYDRPLLLFGGSVYDWSDAQLTRADNLLSLAEFTLPPELLLVGTGAQMQSVAPEFIQALKTHGIAVEVMDSRSAARTYNILVMEGRQVAAALLPPNR